MTCGRDRVYTYYRLLVHSVIHMRTNIEIDDALLAEAMALTGLPTKRATVEEALRRLVRLAGQREILKLAGKVIWEGDLDESRQGRDFGDPGR